MSTITAFGGSLLQVISTYTARLYSALTPITSGPLRGTVLRTTVGPFILISTGGSVSVGAGRVGISGSDGMPIPGTTIRGITVPTIPGGAMVGTIPHIGTPVITTIPPDIIRLLIQKTGPSDREVPLLLLFDREHLYVREQRPDQVHP